MRKFLAISLALVMVLALSVTCFAERITTVPTTKTEDVKISYVAGTSAPDTYAVDVEWDSLTFVYNASGKTWDTTNHVEVNNAGSWQNDTATITVTNHSNVDIKSTIAYAAGTANGEAVATLTGGAETTLAAAEGETVASQTATLKIAGTPALGAESATATIGTLTVTIAAAAVRQ